RSWPMPLGRGTREASPPHAGLAREAVTVVVNGVEQVLEVVRQERFLGGTQAYWVCAKYATLRQHLIPARRRTAVSRLPSAGLPQPACAACGGACGLAKAPARRREGPGMGGGPSRRSSLRDRGASIGRRDDLAGGASPPLPRTERLNAAYG